MPYKEADSNRNGSFCLRRVGLPSTLPKIGDIFSLHTGTTVVGRNPTTSDIFLDSAVHKALISRLHARITTQPNKSIVTVCDTSLNGTYVNDKKILDTEEIRLGDTVTFGHLKGAVLEPGTVAKQHKSEFKFKLEKYPPQEDNNNNNNNSANYANDLQGFLPDLSPFLLSTEEDNSSELQTRLLAHGSEDVDNEDFGGNNQKIRPEVVDDDDYNHDGATLRAIPLECIVGSDDDVLNHRGTNKHVHIECSDDGNDCNNDGDDDYHRETEKHIDDKVNIKEKLMIDETSDTSNDNRITDDGHLTSHKPINVTDPIDIGDSECDNDELLAYAVAAQDQLDDDLSDSELFSVDIPNLSKATNSSGNSSPQMFSQSGTTSPCRASFYFREESSVRKESPLAIDTHYSEDDNADDNKTSSLKRPKRGRASTKKRKPTKAPLSEEKNIPDTCGFRSDCLRPHDRQAFVEWVQCDYCKKWYHLECAGLTLDKVNNTTVKFNCGCVYAA